MRGQCLVERDGILHRQSRARAYREIPCMQGVAKQHAVVMRPARIVHQRKLPPNGIVGDQRMAVECVGKDKLAQRPGVRLAHGSEAGTLEGRGINFDDESAKTPLIAVVVRVEMAELALDERLRQRFETLGGAEPGKTITEIIDTCAEVPRMRAPD